MAVSKRTRYEVLRRDNYTCRYCRATDQPLTVDHVTPVALGGSDDPGNLVAACKDCNAGKASSASSAELVNDVAQDALRWSRAMAAAADILQAQRQEAYTYVDAFDAAWSGFTPTGYQDSLLGLRKAGLPVDEMVDCAYIALTARNVISSRFRYFCGVAWRRVREMQDIAASLSTQEDETPHGP